MHLKVKAIVRVNELVRGQERVIEPWLSSYALYRGRRISRRHVAVTPNSGATKRINDGKENSYVGSNLPIAKANKVTFVRYMHFLKREYIDTCVFRHRI